MILDKAMIVYYDRNRIFIVLATNNMIVNYDRKTFIIQATRVNVITLFLFVTDDGTK